MGFFSDNLEKSKLEAELVNLRMQCSTYFNELIKATDELKKPKTYEYRHIANNQYSKLKDSIVELMNEGWEAVGVIEKEREAYQHSTEYSQIMRKVK